MLKSLRFRLTLTILVLVGIVVAIALSIALWANYADQSRLIKDAQVRALNGELGPVPTIGAQSNDVNQTNMLAISLDINQDGIALQTNDGQSYIDSEVLTEVIREALNSSDSEGRLEKQHVSWMKKPTQQSWRIAIVDTTASDRSFQLTLLRSLEVFAGALVVLFFISWYVSGAALRPVERTWNKQKQFVADASHELKTPLSVILANCDIMLTTDETSKNSTWLSGIQQEARHMNALIADLLELAQSDEYLLAQHTKTQLDKIDLSDVVEAATLEMEALAFERNKELKLDIAPSLTLQGNKEELARLCRILIDNALKYAKENSDIEIALSKNSKQLILSVTNQGDYIPKEKLDHLFDRFYRMDEARTHDNNEQKGFGLGLAIAQNIAHEHGGEIEATSTKEGQTCFSVRLPLTHSSGISAALRPPRPAAL